MELFEKLDRLRLRIRVFSCFVALFPIASVVFLSLNRTHQLFGILSALALVLTLLFLLLIALTVSAYKRLCQSDLVRTLLEDSFENVVYRAKEGLSRESIEQTGMIMMGNSFVSSCYMTGRRRGIHFEGADVAIRQRTPFGKATNTVTFFDGRVMIFHFEKSFGTELLIKEKSFSSAQSPPEKEKRLAFLPVDNEEFNRFFRVYGADEERARYILSLKMCRAILDLNYRLPGDMIVFFSDCTLYVAIHGKKESLEVTVPRKLEREQLRQALLFDVLLASEFAERLRDDATLFLTEKAPSSS